SRRRRPATSSPSPTSFPTGSTPTSWFPGASDLPCFAKFAAVEPPASTSRPCASLLQHLQATRRCAPVLGRSSSGLAGHLPATIAPPDVVQTLLTPQAVHVASSRP
uniref:Uncharacterized protein n=1 Tax=Triticum urartu TaxID=4572 RepID=A0A8R7QTE9_TRIUA